MSKLKSKEVKVKVPKEIFEISEFVGDFVIDIVKHKRDDGKIDQAEIISMVTKLVTKLGGVVEGFDQVDDELKNDPYGFVLSWAASGQKVFDELKKGKPVEEEPEEE